MRARVNDFESWFEGNVTLNQVPRPQAINARFLGLILDKRLNCQDHAKNKHTDLSRR